MMESKGRDESQERKDTTEVAILSLQKELDNPLISIEERKSIENKIAMLTATKDETLPLADRENIEMVLEHLFIEMLRLQNIMKKCERLEETDNEEYIQAKQDYDILNTHYEKAMLERNDAVKRTDN